jgi:hypothetical protein
MKTRESTLVPIEDETGVTQSVAQGNHIHTQCGPKVLGLIFLKSKTHEEDT